MPLSKEALAVLDKAKPLQGDGLIFPSPSGKELSDAAMARLLDREGVNERPHGFRSSFRSWAEEMTTTDHEVKEAALGHVVGTAVERAYQRSDRLEKRSRLMREWGDFVTT